MNTRRLHFIVSLLLVLGVLTSCGRNSASTKPSSPSQVEAQAQEGFILITWEHSGRNVTDFVVSRGVGSSENEVQDFTVISPELGPDAREYKDEDALDPGEEYIYRVVARNGTEESTPVSSKAVQPAPAAGNARLIVTKVGTGQGVVTSEPEGIECIQRPEVLSDCTEDFPEGTEVTLTAQPDAGSVFAGWDGACSGTGECEVTMDSSKEVEAIFSPPESTLSVSKNGDGGGRVVDVNTGGSYIDCGSDCAFTAPTGTTLVLEATPNEGSLFAGWEGCSRIRNNGDCEIQVNTDVTVGATFSQPSLTIESFTASPRNVPPGGQVTLSWNVSGNDDFTLSLSNNQDDEVLNVTGQTSVTVNPDETTTYRLTAESAIETKEDTETVTVGDEPQISLFEIVGGDTTIPTGAEVTLRWEVGGAGDIEVTISGVEGTFGPEDSTTIDISEPGTYEFVLTATSEFGTDTSGPVTITVGNPPEIVSFDADPATIVKDEQSSTLAWEVTGAGDITLTLTGGTEDEDVSGTTETTVSPSATTLYTLTATSVFGRDDADTTVTVEYRLTVENQNDLGGIVTGDGINCGSDCEEVYAGGSVSLTAEPNPGFEFVEWDGACSGTDPNNCTVTMNDNRTVTADFSLLPVDLSVDFQGNGGGTVNLDPPDRDCTSDCTETYDFDETVTLRATADGESDFDGWGGACEGAGDNLECVLLMGGNKNVTATFTTKQFNVTVTEEGSGSGSVAFAPEGEGSGDTRTYDINTPVTLTATEAAGSEFTGWGGDCESFGTDPECDLEVDEDKNVTATFTLQERTLTVDKDGEGDGSITSIPAGIDCGAGCPQDTATFDFGQEVTLTADEASDSEPVVWTNCPNVSGNQCTLTMTDDETVTATFNLSSAVNSVTVTPENPDVDEGDTVQLTATVDVVGDADESVTWSSDDEAVATVNQNGLVTGVSPGTANITATSNTDDSESDTVTVTVNGVTGVTITPQNPPDIEVGGTTQLSADVTTVGDASQDVSWGSSEPSIASVDSSGLVTGESAGGATITATSVFDPNELDSVSVTVFAPNSAPNADAGPDQTDAIVGEEVTLDGTGSSDPDGDPLSYFWDFLRRPGGSSAVLSNANTSTPSFTPDLEGTYNIELTVDDGEATGTDSVSVTAGTVPTIDGFTADPTSIASGASSILQWSATGTGPLSYSVGPDVGDVDGTSVEVSPTSTTEYTLTAENDFGSDTATATVTVGTAPTIESFTATPASITSGNSSTLEWVVSGTALISLSINQGVGDVTGASSTSVSPTETTTYTLSAVNDFGQADADVMVSVEPPLP